MPRRPTKEAGPSAVAPPVDDVPVAQLLAAYLAVLDEDVQVLAGGRRRAVEHPTDLRSVRRLAGLEALLEAFPDIVGRRLRHATHLTRLLQKARKRLTLSVIHLRNWPRIQLLLSIPPMKRLIILWQQPKIRPGATTPGYGPRPPPRRVVRDHPRTDIVTHDHHGPHA